MKIQVALALGLISAIKAGETLVFEDNFDTLDMSRWQHELTMGGGGNWEFEWYNNNRTNSYVKDGVLYLLPTLTADYLGEAGMTVDDVNIWGSNPAEDCTGNAFYGCERNAAASGQVINPVRSARVRSVHSFGFKYGRLEISAKMPRGDWLWPAMWLLPVHNAYGNWPASGEIDLLESRGNDASYPGLGCNTFGSTLHWGYNWDANMYMLTHEDYIGEQCLDDAFHTYGLYWDEDRLFTYIDDESNVVLDVVFNETFWQRGGFSDDIFNPW
jgi:hypothetical protein